MSSWILKKGEKKLSRDKLGLKWSERERNVTYISQWQLSRENYSFEKMKTTKFGFSPSPLIRVTLGEIKV